MAKQTLLKGSGYSAGCGERLDPMLYYCKRLIPELADLDKDATKKLAKDLLLVLKKYRLLFRTEKKTPLTVELSLETKNKH